MNGKCQTPFLSTGIRGERVHKALCYVYEVYRSREFKFHFESFPNRTVSNVTIVARPDSFIICYMKNGKDVSCFVRPLLKTFIRPSQCVLFPQSGLP